MKFSIRRASAYEECPRPCKEAFRDNNDYTWYIHLDDLEDLLVLIDEVDEVIIDHNSIVIYDDYVE